MKELNVEMLLNDFEDPRDAAAFLTGRIDIMFEEQCHEVNMYERKKTRTEELAQRIHDRFAKLWCIKRLYWDIKIEYYLRNPDVDLEYLEEIEDVIDRLDLFKTIEINKLAKRFDKLQEKFKH